MAGKKILVQDAPTEKPVEMPEACGARDNGGSLYSVEDFVAGAREIFGVGPDLVRAALISNRIKECTKDEAQKAVKAFAERKVK